MTEPTPTAPHREPCCEEFERAAGLSRRRMLAGMAAATGAAVTTSVFGDAFRQVSFASTGRRAVGNNVLVVISLRGGIDGLGVVVPHGDPVTPTALVGDALALTEIGRASCREGV